MPRPKVTSLTPRTTLANGLKGLNKTNGSACQVAIGGTNLAAGMPVVIKKGRNVKWTGTLTPTFLCNLMCTNTNTGPTHNSTEDVTVTVGSGTDTSPPFTTPVEVSV